MDKDFGVAFSSDEELKQAFDELVDGLRPDIEDEDSKVTMLDALRLKQIQFAYAALQYITRGTDAVLSYKLNEWRSLRKAPLWTLRPCWIPVC